MKTEQVNLRLEADLIAAIEEASREDALDRGTMIRKLLVGALSRRRLDRALERYRAGEISIGRAAEVAGISHHDIMDEVERHGIAYPLDVGEVEEMLASLPRRTPRVAEGPRASATKGAAAARGESTLPDRPPRPGGVLLVGINPAPGSVRAGHYYQGPLGRRLWKRLARLGLIPGATPGEEDDAFVRAGHGLTDVVQRPTRTASDIRPAEFRQGVEALRVKVRAWKPGLILFAFKAAASAAAGTSAVRPGPGPDFEGVPTFLLEGPYRRRDLVDRGDERLRSLIAAPTSAPRRSR